MKKVKQIVLAGLLLVMIIILSSCGEKTNGICDACEKEKAVKSYRIVSPSNEVRYMNLCNECAKDYKITVAMLNGSIEEAQQEQIMESTIMEEKQMNGANDYDNNAQNLKPQINYESDSLKQEEFSSLSADSGPIVIKEDDTQFVLYRLNINDNKLVPIFSFTRTESNSKYRTSYEFSGNFVPNYFNKQLFSDDLTKMAVNWYEQIDGSSHVGWIDKNGKLTDVTSNIHPTTTGFTKEVPDDRTALFSPDGYFFFCNEKTKKCCYVDINTLTIVREEDYPVFRNSSRDYTTYQLVFLPDGELIRDPSTDSWGKDYIWWYAEKDSNYTISFSRNTGRIPSVVAFDLIDRGKAVGIGNYGYIIKYGVGISERDETYHKYNHDMDDVVKITPQTEYSLIDCVCHNERVVFLAKKGQERKLYTTDINGSIEPEEIGDLPSDMKLFFWK